MQKVLKNELMAILPQYVDNRGNCTILYTKKEQPLILEKNIKSVLRKICKYYMLDLQETKKRYAPLISSPGLVPIPFSRKDIFIPLKTRLPLCKNDGAMGYVNMKHIKNITKSGNTTNIHLVDGTIINCLYSIITVNNHIRDGNIVSRCYLDRAMKVAEEEELVYDGKKPIIIIYEK